MTLHRAAFPVLLFVYALSGCGPEDPSLAPPANALTPGSAPTAELSPTEALLPALEAQTLPVALPRPVCHPAAARFSEPSAEPRTTVQLTRSPNTDPCGAVDGYDGSSLQRGEALFVAPAAGRWSFDANGSQVQSLSLARACVGRESVEACHSRGANPPVLRCPPPLSVDASLAAGEAVLLTVYGCRNREYSCVASVVARRESDPRPLRALTSGPVAP